MQNSMSAPAKVVHAPQQTINAWTKPFVPSMKEFPVATSANRTKRSLSSNHQATNTTPTNRGRTNGRCTESNTHSNISTQGYFYREHSSSTCTQENNGDSHRRYQHTHRIEDTVLPNNDPYQGHPHSSCRAGKVVSKTGHPNYSSDTSEGDGLVLNNDPYHDHTHSTSWRSTTTIGTQRAATHIKIVRTRSNYKHLYNQDSHRTR